MRSLKVSDVMWNHIDPIRCGTSLSKVVDVLLRNHVTGLPVVDGKRHVLGFVSEQDCIHALLVASYHHEGEPVVEDVMFSDPLTVPPEMAMVDLAQNLGRNKPKVYPVVEGGKLVGIVTRASILQALARSGYGSKVPKFATEDD